MHTAEDIKALISLEQVLSSMYGLEVKSRIDCPIHGGDNCFTIKEDYFKCHSCKASGDLFAFVMEIEKVDFNEAKRQIKEHFRIESFSDKEIKERSRKNDRRKRELFRMAKTSRCIFQRTTRKSFEICTAFLDTQKYHSRNSPHLSFMELQR